MSSRSLRFPIVCPSTLGQLVSPALSEECYQNRAPIGRTGEEIRPSRLSARCPTRVTQRHSSRLRGKSIRRNSWGLTYIQAATDFSFAVGSASHRPCGSPCVHAFRIVYNL